MFEVLWMSRPLILLSNDDGVNASGLRALMEHFRSFADVWVVAPDRERSAISQALSLHFPLRITDLGEQVFALDGTPTDCVYVAMNHLLPRRPDLVVSGINHGPNLGNDVLYSGTVGAAMEGALSGVPAIAVSLCLPDNVNERKDSYFDSAAEFAGGLAQQVIESPMAPGVVLNVNVPNHGTSPKGVKLCRLGYTDWSGSVKALTDPRGKPYYWIGGERLGRDNITDSDNNAIIEGYISVTPLHYDLTDYRSFEKFRDLSIPGFETQNDTLGDQPLDRPKNPRFATRLKSV